jgi:hypothetical protein
MSFFDFAAIVLPIIEHLDWLAAARVHPIDQIITKAFSVLPAFILGYSDASLPCSPYSTSGTRSCCIRTPGSAPGR